MEALNTQLRQAQRLAVAAAVDLKQRQLSQLLDQAVWDTQLAQATASERAVLHPEAGLGARAFLAALPSGCTRVESALASVSGCRMQPKRLGVLNVMPF